MRDCRYRTRKVYLDSSNDIIIVEYTVEKRDNRSGESSVGHKQAKIQIGPLAFDANVSKLANSIAKNNKYISDKYVLEVENAIDQLLLRQFPNLLEAYNEDRSKPSSFENAHIDKVGSYLDLLYSENTSKKIDGAAMVLQVCKDVENFEPLVQNKQLMSAISRIYNDDFELSLELNFNLCRIFLALSNFSETHTILCNLGIGGTTLKMIDLELRRVQHRTEADYANTSDEEKVAVLKQHDSLIFVGLSLLQNLAENTGVERKMVKKGLVRIVSSFLDYSKYTGTIRICLKFMLKLSLVEENVHSMVCQSSIQRLLILLSSSHSDTVLAVLRILLNLSFKEENREVMIELNLIKHLVKLLKRSSMRAKTLRLMYNLSTDTINRAAFAKSDAVHTLVQLIVNFPRKQLAKELVALTINLTLNSSCADQFLRRKCLRPFLSRIQAINDILLMKVVRNLSLHTMKLQGTICSNITANKDSTDDTNYLSRKTFEREYLSKHYWDNHVSTIIQMALNTDNLELLLEVIGTLCNFTRYDMPRGRGWADMVYKYPLMSFVERLLVPGMAQMDTLLEVVILIGQVCDSAEAAALIAASSIIRCLDGYWGENIGNEFALQLLETSYRLMLFTETREELLQNSNSVSQIISRITSQNSAIGIMTERCLSLLLEFDRNEEGKIGGSL
mmetsp:Transcript_60/g.88  ORF Transcript_60/g.88 Transcript_60/m.88 type:complete len:675 (-) Transcript_60:2-2026(-)